MPHLHLDNFLTNEKLASPTPIELRRLSYYGAEAATGTSKSGGLLLERDGLQLRLADSLGHRNECNMLVDRMYAWRGYRRKSTDSSSDDRADQITLQASQDEQICGTLTVRYDSTAGLAADLLYRSEIDAYRIVGARVAELTRLAVDPEHGSKEVLGALFHAAYVLCGPLRAVSDVFIEVHPRHVPFYRRMLNFQLIGGSKICPRVDAPAMLLRVEVDHVGEQAALYGGKGTQGGRSLYPYFCSAEEAAAMRQRMWDLKHQGLPTGRTAGTAPEEVSFARRRRHALA